MIRFGKKWWKTMPFIRLLVMLIIGIVVQFYMDAPVVISIYIIISSSFLFIGFTVLPVAYKYHVRWLTGAVIHIMMMAAGMQLTYWRDITHHTSWIGHHYRQQDEVLAVIATPPVEKTRSYKVVARAISVWNGRVWTKVKGDLLLYFSKDSNLSLPAYGQCLLVTKPLQQITNPGNPGEFDYRRYCAFQNIHYEAYLQNRDYRLTGVPDRHAFAMVLLRIRDYILASLRKAIHGEKETGVAEALLIGYKDELDKNLLQSYSNTGVVHIIAISGMHLGMIYGLLLLLFRPFSKQRWVKWVKPVVVLTILWLFSLLAGAAPSILRSAVMFSFVVIGESIHRKSSMYNALAASAFCLLVYDPYSLWDVGFQLSYLAVFGILLLLKPVYRSLYIKNKILDAVWQLNAVTLSAQVFTLPVVLYYFHQFPLLFLFTNFFIVPLSGFILYGCLLLLMVSYIPFIGTFTGNIVSFLITQMNGLIERTDTVPYAAVTRINTSLVQTYILYGAIIFFSCWLLQQRSKHLLTALVFLCLFFCTRFFSTAETKRQRKIIVYNIPRHTAIDLVAGNEAMTVADTALLRNTSSQKFYLEPARISNDIHRIRYASSNQFFRLDHTSVLLLAQPPLLRLSTARLHVNIIILSGSPQVYLRQLAAVFDCDQYIFDSSNPLWKIRYWKKDADSLHLRHYSVPEQGAFEITH